MYTPIDKASRGQSCGDGMKRGKERMRIIGTAVGCRLPEGPLGRSSLLISITHLPGGREGKMMLDCLHERLSKGSSSDS